MSDPATIALAALAGYLVGSISFARVIGRVVAPARPLGSDTLSFGADGTVVDRSSGTSGRPAGLAGSIRGHPVRLHGGSARRLT